MSMQTLLAVIQQFSTIDLTILVLSLILFLAATPICRWLRKNDYELRARMMRILNLLIIAAIIAKVWLSQYAPWFIRITQSLIIIYFAILLAQILNFIIRKRFGKPKKNNDELHLADTYASRGLSLLSGIAISVIALISCLQILGFDSLIQTGGILSIIGIFLALTQASWAPDIISGLIILNSRLCEEGDVVQFKMDNELIIASVFKTKLFHTEFLDLSNNHRIMVRNARLRDYGVNNLSRFASAKGLRECLIFNIGYEHKSSDVISMFERAFKTLDEAENIRQEQFKPEIRVQQTGDYAVSWAVFYYIKNIKDVLAIRQTVLAYILDESLESGISLATPVLQENLIKNKAGQT